MARIIKSSLTVNNILSLKINRHLSFSAALSMFLFIITMMFGLAICAVVFIQVDALVKENRQDFIQQEMQGIARELENYLSLRNSALKEYASFPLVTQTVMQPNANQGNIEDLMKDLTLLGSRVPLTLFDYAGAIIHTTHHSTDQPTIAHKTLMSLSNAFHFIFDSSTDQFIILILTPVFYQNNIEGYLQADIPISTLIEDIAIRQHTKQHRIQIKSGQKILVDMGLMDHPVTDTVKINSVEIELAYNTDEKTLQNTRLNLLLSIMFWLFIVSIIIVIASNKLGYILLINPLQRLQNFANDLADGKKIKMSPSINKFEEIYELENHFKTMIDKVMRREQSLSNAKDSLQELNDKLVEHQQQLLHSEKLASVGQLAAGVAHEINNPTGFVMGNLEVLAEYKDDILQLLTMYDDLEEHIENDNKVSINASIKSIQDYKTKTSMDYTLKDMHNLISDSIDGSRRIKNIVKDLKNFSRVDSVEKTPVDINGDVIEIALRLVWNELKYKCTLNKSLSPLPIYKCNPGELSQVILNLLVNASDAIKDNGEISISSTFMEDYIQIQVSDNGSGIENKDLIKLFDPFFTTKEVGKGTGLGLSISHRIIEKHGGVLSVASQVGHGTVFTIMLPIEEEEQLDDSKPVN